VDVFSWGDGGGRESARARSVGSVAGRRALSNSPILVYIIYCAVEVSLQDAADNRGMLLLVPPRSSGYDVYAHVIYVVTMCCYMLLYVICLL
jgi:hypothetical protein